MPKSHFETSARETSDTAISGNLFRARLQHHGGPRPLSCTRTCNSDNTDLTCRVQMQSYGLRAAPITPSSIGCEDACSCMSSAAYTCVRLAQNSVDKERRMSYCLLQNSQTLASDTRAPSGIVLVPRSLCLSACNFCMEENPY